jgi:hypothetical protein
MTDKTNLPPRRIEARRWVALGTVAAVGLATAAPAHAVLDKQKTVLQGTTAQVLLVASSGGEGSEGGEGGEGAAARDGDAEFLAALGFIEGHLRAGIALYEAGEAHMAGTHMKHPGDEIYRDLEPGLKERNAKGFESELAELAEAVESGASVDDAKAALAEVLHEVEEAREHTGGGAAARLRSIVLIAREAAHEYEEAVEGGKIAELHEYQDAWGFLEAARAMADELSESDNPEVVEAVAKIRAQLDEVAPAFTGVVPAADFTPADPSLIYGAAARMELAALAVK